MSRKWRNWYQNEVYEETKEADSRDKVKHNGRSDLLFVVCGLSVKVKEEKCLVWRTVMSRVG